MVVRPRVFGNVGTWRIIISLDISNVFLSPSFKATSSFTNITPWAVLHLIWIGRKFKTRRKEHVRNVKTYASSSNIANIDFHNKRIIDKTLESWHTANTKDADNNSKPLPEPFN